MCSWDCLRLSRIGANLPREGPVSPMSTPRTGREIHLASRPTGWPVPENFSIVEATVPDPAAGQVLIRNQFMSVDPYMRGRMNDVKSYVPPFQVGAALDGGAVGVVVASN